MRALAAIAALGLLCGCTSLMPGGQGTPAPATQATLTGLVLAIEAPAGLQPVPGQSRLVTASDPAGVPLVFADADIAEGSLPAPAQGRAYFFLKPEVQPVVSTGLGVRPVWCIAAQLGAGSPVYSVLVIAPGGTAFVPLADNQPALAPGSTPAAC